MLCDNCGKREANVKYSENINGNKKELHLCEECSEKLGIGKMDFNMPIDFSSFFGGLLEDFGTTDFMPLFDEVKNLKCNSCGYTFEDIVNTGRLGCGNCYDVFEDRLDPIIKKIQGSNRHIGRTGKIIDSKIEEKFSDSKKEDNKEQSINKEVSEIEKLQNELKQAIKDERYEDAAKIRDEIKKIEDVAVSTRIRFARNLNSFRFNLNKKEEIEQLEKVIKDNLYKIGYGLKFLKLKDMDDITKMSLVEKHLLSPNFVLKRNELGSILINDEENICIMIGEEDHLRIQVFNCGLDLENTLNLAIELDEKIGEVLGYAVSKKYGYLTSCPSDLGTGLKASVMVHLPALSKTKNTRRVLDAINNFGVNIRGIYGETTEGLGDMYQLSNQQTLGISEREIIKNLNVIVEKIIEQERQARKLLAKDELELEDMIYRSYGILTNCRKISSEEVRDLLSNIKLGTDLGILPELTDLKVQKLYLYTKPANLQKYFGSQYEAIERDIKRAEVIRQILEEK